MFPAKGESRAEELDATPSRQVGLDPDQPPYPSPPFTAPPSPARIRPGTFASGRDLAERKALVRELTVERGDPLKQFIGYVALVIGDYDEAIHFSVDTLGFGLVEDTYIEGQDKRWVLIAPPGATETKLLLARAAGPEQASRVGDQTGGRVFLFLHTDDFWRDFKAFQAKGVTFVREPKRESYGTVAVFEDIYGNLWDLLQLEV